MPDVHSTGSARHGKARAPNIRDLIRLGREAEGARAIDDLNRQAMEVFEPGELIPGTQYEIRRSLAEGDTGVLYEVQHRQIRKRAAAKIMRSSLAGNRDELRRIRDAARAVNQIQSPNIVETYDFATLHDGRVMVIMELVDGCTVAQAVMSQPMFPARTIGVLRQLCRALAAGHAAGHLHGSVDGSHVMLTEVGERSDFVKVLGLAASAESGRRYLSPEERAGSDPDQRADVYAVGCLAHLMSSGRELEAGEAAEIPEPLLEVIRRCTREEPAERYADMADLEAALCEAQIALQLVTPWDDLPVPRVDPERRDRIIASMPDPAAASLLRRRRWTLSAIGLALVLATGVTTFVFTSRDEVTEAESSRLDTLVAEARDAAAKAYYIYPSPREPDHPTAYAKVVQLETIDDASQALARQHAAALRAEFSQTLFDLGDRYWEEEGGRRFAQGYYIQGLIFDRSNEQARERAGATPQQIIRLAEAAAAQSFASDELDAVEPLLVLAEEDPQERDRKLEELRERRQAQAAEEDAALQALAGEQDGEAEQAEQADASVPVAQPRRTGKSKEDERERVVALLEAYLAKANDEQETELIENLLTVMKEREPGSGGVGDVAAVASATRSSRSRDAARDPRAAADEVATGTKRLRQGDYRGAEAAFHRALSADYKSDEALAGLGDVYFERGVYQKAAKYLRKAVALAPGKSAYHMRLGDSYFKILRYAEARKQYARADKLGASGAAAALAKVDRRLGD